MTCQLSLYFAVAPNKTFPRFTFLSNKASLGSIKPFGKAEDASSSSSFHGHHDSGLRKTNKRNYAKIPNAGSCLHIDRVFFRLSCSLRSRNLIQMLAKTQIYFCQDVSSPALISLPLYQAPSRTIDFLNRPRWQLDENKSCCSICPEQAATLFIESELN